MPLQERRGHLHKPFVSAKISGIGIYLWAAALRRRKRGDMVPKDPVMLLSFVNLKLRDFYGTLDTLCEDLDVDRQEIEEKLGALDYRYDKERNQFV